MEIENIKIITESNSRDMERSILLYVSWGYTLIGNVQFTISGHTNNRENFCATMVKYKISEI